MVIAHQSLIHPYQLGTITVDIPINLAPMAGHSNRAFRQIVRELGGCGVVCTEVLSSVLLGNKGTRQRSLEKFPWDAVDEYPMAVQLFGANPQVVAEAAKIVVDHGATIVDINMGCWVPKIAKKGGGAALMRDVCTARAVVEAVVNAVDVPVTVKVRSGFEDGVVTAIPFAKAAEEVGVKAIAVHARFAGQGHQGEADWDVIRDVKLAVPNMPVIGNGDVRQPEDAERMLTQTGCDGVMVGRGALGRPWVFKHMAHYLETGEILPEPTRSERAQIALRYAELNYDYAAIRDKAVCLQMRKQLSKYSLDEVGTVHIRNQLVKVESIEDIRAILEPIIAQGDA
ncbi:MAG: tRNA dihydrouridine synthase DusB [Phototrophicaceae bacterium]